VAGVSRYEDLVVWRLANDLRRRVALTATGPASKDFKFRDQVRDSAASVTRNIAEGFGRFADAEFAWFRRVAHGSFDGNAQQPARWHQRGYVTVDETTELQGLAIRAIKAATGLIRYLEPRDGKAGRRFPRHT
jgi:four helix bundle protein